MREPVVETWVITKHGTPAFPNRPKHPLYERIVDILEGWGEDDEDRKAIEAWAWERISYREIAEQFGLSGRTSGFYRVQRAINRLRKELEGPNANSS